MLIFIGKAGQINRKKDREKSASSFRKWPQKLEVKPSKTRVGSFYWVSHKRSGSQEFEPSSAMFLGHKQGAGRQTGADGTQTGAQMGSWHL